MSGDSACDALGMVLYALRHHTQLCRFASCDPQWLPARCDFHPEMQQKLRDQLPQHVAQVIHLGERAQWGRMHVRVRVPLSDQWSRFFSDQVGGARYPSTDIVIARCTEPVATWLPGLLVHFPALARLRIFLYETCSSLRRSTSQSWATPWAYWLDVPIIRRSVENRGFESAVYLRHMVLAAEADDLAETTLFLQAGWQEHTRKLLACDWLENFMAKAPFMQYGARYSTLEGNGCWDVCMSHHVWAVALPGHDPLRAASASYAIFHAHRHRIKALGLRALKTTLDVATMRSLELRARLCGSSLPWCPGHGCNKRLSKEYGFAQARLYCNDSGKLAGIGLELGWHVLLGEPDALPFDRAPLSEVASSFFPPKGGPWRPPLTTPCGTSGSWEGEGNNTRMTTRLKRVLLRLVNSGLLLLSSKNHSVLGPAGRSTLRYIFHNRSLARTRKKSLLPHKSPSARWESEETYLLSTMTGWDTHSQQERIVYSQPFTRERVNRGFAKSQPIGGLHTLPSSIVLQQTLRAPPSPCCRWVKTTQRQPRHTTCGEADEREPGWWRSSSSNVTTNVLHIRMNHGSAGFFAYLLFALNQLAFAQRQKLMAYVDFGRCTVNGHDHYSSGGANLYFDGTAGPNMWDYYFEPVSSYRPGLKGFQGRALPSKTLWRLHHKESQSIFAYYYGMYSYKRAYDESWYRTMRERASRLLLQYVRPRAHIVQAVDQFWSSHFAPGAYVVGVHMRGTDKKAEIGGEIVPPQRYMFHIDSHLRERPHALIFLATDSPLFLRLMRERYGAKVFARNALRSERNAFLDLLADGTNARKGADVLIDSLLLSRCSFLLKSSSAVGEFAIYFNLSLHSRSLDLQYTGTNRSTDLDNVDSSASITIDSQGGRSRAVTCTSREVLAMHTDICSTFLQCDQIQSRAMAACQVPPEIIRRAQSLYGAFRMAYNSLPTAVQDSPDEFQSRSFSIHERYPSKSVNLVVSRCHEPVLDFLQMVYPFLGSTTRLIVEERCVDHKGRPARWPSTDIRDELLGIRRLAVATNTAPCVKRHTWSSQTSFTMCIQARELIEPETSASCIAQILSKASESTLPGVDLVERSPLPHNGIADEAVWFLVGKPSLRQKTSSTDLTSHETWAVMSRENFRRYCSRWNSRQSFDAPATNPLGRVLGNLLKKVDELLSPASIRKEAGLINVTSMPATAIQASAACSEPNFMLYNRELWPASWPGPSSYKCSWSKDRDSLLSHLRKIQGTTSNRDQLQAVCTKQKFLVTRLLPAGWWSTVLGALKPLGHALRTDRTILTPKVRPFVDPNVCPQIDLSCFFLPLAPACDAIATNNSREAKAHMPAPSWLRWLPGSSLLSRRFVSRESRRDRLIVDLNDDVFVRGESASNLPQAYKLRGWFWWTSHLLQYITRPSQRLLHDLELEALESGLSSALASGVSVIGVHVRHGDSCSAKERHRMARVCAPFEDYLGHIRVLSQRLKTTTIFLATDDLDVWKAATTLPNLTVLTMRSMSRLSAKGPRPQLWDKLVLEREANHLSHLNQRGAWDATIDAMLLARCDGLIGKFTSTLFRAAMSMKSASCGCIPPFVSLDAPWCFDYGVKAGENWEFPLPSAYDEVGRGENRFWC
mmetsp:Transcript_5788/g.18075  ORF Transcript_5788/g.18075 Transcript_5788/m.18075 type:complete len:1617 (+) Transcript_5788:79-4929(+)